MPFSSILTHRRKCVEKAGDVGHDTPFIWASSIAQICYFEKLLKKGELHVCVKSRIM